MATHTRSEPPIKSIAVLTPATIPLSIAIAAVAQIAALVALRLADLVAEYLAAQSAA
jgi:hypothetical protein